jgi:hypothetical protein
LGRCDVVRDQLVARGRRTSCYPSLYFSVGLLVVGRTVAA